MKRRLRYADEGKDLLDFESAAMLDRRCRPNERARARPIRAQTLPEWAVKIPLTNCGRAGQESIRSSRR